MCSTLHLWGSGLGPVASPETQFPFPPMRVALSQAASEAAAKI